MGRGTWTLQGVVGALDLYLLTLLAAAATARREDDPPGDADALRLLVLVPAHDEERGIARSVEALLANDYPADLRRVVVVADNCSDATAATARAAGAEVLERVDPGRRGKGHALNWALDRVDAADAVVFVDADCEATPNLLRALAARLGGASAAQAAYVVSNPGASTSATLRYAAFALMNTVRPLGKDRLGLSAGLLGTGMALRRDVVDEHRFDTGSVVEDAELHLRLVAAGHRVRFAPGAAVHSAMPASAPDSAEQQTRWEGGRFGLIARWVGPLLVTGLRRRDPVRVHAALENLVPPQSILVLLNLGSALAGLVGGRRARRLGFFGAVAQAAFVLGGLRVAGAPADAYRALRGAPALVVQKLGVFGRMARRGTPSTWQRTARG